MSILEMIQREMKARNASEKEIQEALDRANTDDNWMEWLRGEQIRKAKE